jgi:hypothetical protein
MLNQDCECAACQARRDKPLTEAELEEHQRIADQYWAKKNAPQVPLADAAVLAEHLGYDTGFAPPSRRNT